MTFPLFPIPRLQVNPLSRPLFHILCYSRNSHCRLNSCFLMQLYPSAPATFASFWKRREPVVAADYAEFSLARARVIRLRHDELGYASYHLADYLYWLLDEKEDHLL